MLDQPAAELVASGRPAAEGRVETHQVQGLHGHRSATFVQRWRQYTGIHTPVQLDVRRAPAEHVGLGLGTQLGMSIATALDHLFGRGEMDVETRAESVGRGLRSAVGAHGFCHGGLIVDRGKADGDTLGELREHITLPPDWHVVLLRTPRQRGLAGKAEVQAFQELSAIPNCRSAKDDGPNHQAHRPTRAFGAQSQALQTILDEALTPAARQGDFARFSRAVYDYGVRAGEMFSEMQGGTFLNETVAELVAYSRRRGVDGVGQSSWGPTVFCWFDSRPAAERFMADVRSDSDPNLEMNMTVSAVSRGGAQVTVS